MSNFSENHAFLYKEKIESVRAANQGTADKIDDVTTTIEIAILAAKASFGASWESQVQWIAQMYMDRLAKGSSPLYISTEYEGLVIG